MSEVDIWFGTSSMTGLILNVALFAIAAAVIVLAITSRRRGEIEISGVRFSSFLLGMVAFAAVVSSAVLYPFLEGTALQVTSIAAHGAGLCFFTLFCFMGASYFAEENNTRGLARVGIGLSAVSAVFIFGYAAVSYGTAGEILHLSSIDISMHVAELVIGSTASGFILAKFLSSGFYPRPTELPSKYPLGVGVVLLLCSVVVHLFALANLAPGWAKGGQIALGLTGLGAITVGARRLHRTPPSTPVGETSRQWVGSLTHISRLIYYGNVDFGTGKRELLLKEFLGRCSLSGFYDHDSLSFVSEELERGIAESPELASEVLYESLGFFLDHKHLVSAALVERLGETLPELSEDAGLGPKEKTEVWRKISALCSDLPTATVQEGLSPLMSWGVRATSAFFEKKHPIGIDAITPPLGTVRSGSKLLVLKDPKVNKRTVRAPILEENLKTHRTCIYLGDDPEKALPEGGLPDREEEIVKLIAYDPELTDINPHESGSYSVPDEKTPVVSTIRRSLKDLPLSSTIGLLNLTPLLVKEGKEEIRDLLKQLGDLGGRENATFTLICPTGVDGEKQNLLIENSENVISVKVKGGELVYEVLKTESGEGKLPDMTISEKLLETLKFIHRRNREGSRPNLEEIRSNLSIARGTARRRVEDLEKKKLVNVERAGRSKVLNVTEKGARLILRPNGD